MIESILRFKKEMLIGIFILLVAFLLRFVNLTKLPVFADEAIYIRWSQVMRAEQTLRFLPLTDGKQPLVMWVVIPFLKIFNDPLFAGRFVSVLSGMGTLVGIFTLSLLLFRPIRLALFASLLYAISPFAVFFDRLALADAMLTFFGVWFLVFSVMTVKYLRLDSAMLAGFALGGAWLTKSPALYFALLSPSFVLLLDLPKKRRLFLSNIAKYMILFGVSLVIGFGLYNILRLGPSFHMIALRNQDYVYPISHAISSPLDPFKPFLHRIFEYFWILGPFISIIFFVFGSLFGLVKYKKETLLLLVFALVPMIISAEFSKTMTARYVYFSVPYVFLLGSLTFLDFKNQITGSISSLLKGKLKIILFLIFLGHALYNDFLLLIDPEKVSLPRSERSGYLEEWTAGQGIKEASIYLKNQTQTLLPGKQIVVGTEGYFGTLPDGLQIYLNNNQNITIIGVGQPIREVHNSLKESKKAGNPTYLLVNDSRFIGDYGSLGLKLIARYEKALKPDGNRESLLFLELN